MKQSRRMSVVEACVGTAIGLVISVIANLILMPMYGYHVTTWESVQLSFFFTLISIARSYAVRRLFEHWRPIYAD